MTSTNDSSGPPPRKVYLGALDAKTLEGTESFHVHAMPLPLTVLDFWRWSGSAILDNAQRGILAEFLVARAVGDERPVRTEWATYDVQAPNGLSIEVKSAAYLQSWPQERPSAIQFSIGPTKAWSSETGRFEAESRRQADLYVLALLHHCDKETVDPLDLSQWSFYVVPTELLDREAGAQKSIALSRIEALGIEPCGYGELGERVLRARRGDDGGSPAPE